MRTSHLASRRTVVVSVFAASIGLAQSVHGAFLEGHVLRVNLLHKTNSGDTLTGPDADVVVGPEVELRGFGFQEIPAPLPALVDIDISDSQILISAIIDQPFADTEVIQFFDSEGTISGIRRVRVNSATNWAGFDPVRAFGLGDQITVNLSQLSGLTGQQILLDVIPEPAAGTLILGAGPALAAARRRRS